MVNLPVDEAYALDYYAILLVKNDKGLPVSLELERVGVALKRQIPEWFEVVKSAEFHALYQANLDTFDAVAKCKHSAAQVANRTRFLAKRELQRKFWPDCPLTEQKRKGD